MAKHSLRDTAIVENAIKNVFVVVLLYMICAPLEVFIGSLDTDATGYQSIIILSSLLIMAFLFAAYTFTFKDSDMTVPSRRMLDYINTGITYFGCGALLEISYFAINAQLKTNFTFMGVLMALFYLALVMFDFWDLHRAFPAESKAKKK